MKAASTALANLLASARFVQGAGPPGAFTPFDLYTITLSTGLVLTYTTADFPITAPSSAIFNAPKLTGSGTVWTAGMTWKPFPIDMSGTRSTSHNKLGLDSDTWQVTVAPRPANALNGGDLIGSLPWLQAAAAGALASADCIVARAYFATMPSHDASSPAFIGAGAVPVGTLILFRGYLGEIAVDNTTAVLSINDYRRLLQQTMPRNIYMPSCRNIFGGARCGVSAATYAVAGVAAAGSTLDRIASTTVLTAISRPGDPGAGAAPATFTLGTLKMTSGLNAGFSRFVRLWDGANTFRLLTPFNYAIAGGDTFTVTQGCDHTLATCNAFGNFGNYNGEPYVPAPETVLT